MGVTPEAPSSPRGKQPLALLLTDLRVRSGLSLRQVERATDDEVSNVYLSQLEHGLRTDPNPRILVALARVYGLPVKELFEAAGYVDAPSPTEIDTAFEQVLADREFHFGTRASKELDQASKKTIVRMYERLKHRKLLPDDEG